MPILWEITTYKANEEHVSYKIENKVYLTTDPELNTKGLLNYLEKYYQAIYFDKL